MAFALFCESWWKLVFDLFLNIHVFESLTLLGASSDQKMKSRVCGGCDFSLWQREYFGGSIFQWQSAPLQMFSCDVFQSVYSIVMYLAQIN